MCVGSCFLLITACGNGEPRLPDLPRQPDRWVNTLTSDPDSTITYVGQTKGYLVTSTTTMSAVEHRREVKVGDVIEGLTIGAIQCTFFWRDESYAGKQYMWRGRWGCSAGRSRDEVERAVADNGDKRFPTLRISPVTLN
jgi:hypothetical protein